MEEINDGWMNDLDSLFWYNTACSGLPDCEFCIKRMYPIRTKYSKKWFRWFVNNFDDIQNGTITRHNFIWQASPNAKVFDIESFIASHPHMDNIFRYFLTHVYVDGTSLDIIYQLYKST